MQTAGQFARGVGWRQIVRKLHGSLQIADCEKAVPAVCRGIGTWYSVCRLQVLFVRYSCCPSQFAVCRLCDSQTTRMQGNRVRRAVCSLQILARPFQRNFVLRQFAAQTEASLQFAVCRGTHWKQYTAPFQMGVSLQIVTEQFVR